MDIYRNADIAELIKDNSYVGRGIIIGKSSDAKSAVCAYFIMGRSENSRNRVFIKTDDGIVINAYDPSKLEDPSLIIYSPVRTYKNSVIVTNGDQTDTVYDFLKDGGSFEEALNTREFEPDAPNFTPRISGIMDFADKDFTYKMNILKSADAAGTACNRYNFAYKALAGTGHFIHTYNCDGNPIPTFTGEPERVMIPDDIETFTGWIWENLDADNKVSLYVRYTDLETGEYSIRIVNKHSKA